MVGRVGRAPGDAVFARSPAADPRDVAEIENISRALFVYRNRYGEYPPDFSSGDPRTEIETHLRKCFSNRLEEVDLPSDLSQLGPHNALYFWLKGFSSDPEKPLTGKKRGMSPLHDFSITRFQGDTYYPNSGKAPFVYFCGRQYANAKCKVPGCGVAYPYIAASSGNTRTFENNGSFQILCAGKDGYFGEDQAVTGTKIFGGHTDNLSNFAMGPLGNQAILRVRRSLARTRIGAALLSAICTMAYPFVVLSRSKPNGVQELRKLVTQQAKAEPTSGRWQSILNAGKEARKSNAIRRLSTRANGREHATAHGNEADSL